MARPNSLLSRHSQGPWNSPEPNLTEVIRVGIIGSGLAGLVTAYSLATISTNMKFKSRDETAIKMPVLEVHLFESSPKLGLSHASTQVSVSDDDKLHQEDGSLEQCASEPGRRHWNIDSPMRAIQSGYYKHLGQLYRFLGISLTKTDFSYNFYGTPSYEFTPRRASLLYEGTDQFHLGKISKPSYIITWFSFDGIWHLYSGLFICLTYVLLLITSALSYHARNRPTRDQSTSFVGFLFACALHSLGIKAGFGKEEIKYLSLRGWRRSSIVPSWSKWCLNRKFRRELLEPIFSSICSCSIDELDNYLVTDIFDFMWLTFGTSYYVCSQGVKTVAKILTQPLGSENIHLGTDGTITQILPISAHRSQIHIITQSEKQYAFDHLVFATQADQLKNLLTTMCDIHPPENPSAERERIELLGRFPYCKTLVVNHMDSQVLSDDAQDWRDLNFTTSFPLKRVRTAQPSRYLVTAEKAGSHWRSELARKVDEDSKSSVLHIESSASSSFDSLAQFSSSDKEFKSPDSTYHCVFDEEAYWMSTHIIHRPSSVKDGQLLLQTTNPITPITPSLTINQTWFNRVLVNADSRRAYHQLKDGPALGLHQIWFTGSWFSEGIPLLEGCVTSSELIVKRLVKHLLQKAPDEQLELKFVWED